MANSATRVLPAPVGAETITDWPAAMARMASTWKSSRGKDSEPEMLEKLHRSHYHGESRREQDRDRRSMSPSPTADDYLTRREPHRRAHIERLQGLRAGGILIGGGPAPDGRSADIFYRLQQPGQLKTPWRRIPYWTGGAWTRYEPRSFSQFVEPWEMVAGRARRLPAGHDRRGPDARARHGPVRPDRDARRGPAGLRRLLRGRQTLALAKSADPAEARRWFADTGFWPAERLTTRPLLHVL